MPPLTSDDALALCKSYRDLSVAIGDFRFKNWNTLSEGDRKAPRRRSGRSSTPPRTW